MFYLSICLVILGTILYDLLEKTVPRKVNEYLYLMFTYLFALIMLIVVLLFVNYNFKNIMKDINIQSIMVGICAMFADYGLILAYRKGWKISTLNISYTISVLLILIVIGSTFLNETITKFKLLGIVFCLIAIVLINIKNVKRVKKVN